MPPAAGGSAQLGRVGRPVQHGPRGAGGPGRAHRLLPAPGVVAGPQFPVAQAAGDPDEQLGRQRAALRAGRGDQLVRGGVGGQQPGQVGVAAAQLVEHGVHRGQPALVGVRVGEQGGVEAVLGGAPTGAGGDGGVGGAGHGQTAGPCGRGGAAHGRR